MIIQLMFCRSIFVLPKPMLSQRLPGRSPYAGGVTLRYMLQRENQVSYNVEP